jgi:anaerobic magnesium-protoporphyrin IX monomethyl ester cyclase
MRVLFLNPPVKSGERYMKELGRCGRRSVAGETWPQTGLAYLAAVVEQEHHEARILDAMATPITLQALLEDVERWHPHLIVIGTTTPTFGSDAEAARAIQDLSAQAGRSQALICFAGTHVSALPEQSLSESRADIIMINEAEETVRQLVRLLDRMLGESGTMRAARGRLFPEAAQQTPLREIRGIVFRCGDSVVLTEPRPFIENLDTLPPPARHLLPNESYKMPFFEDEPFVTVIPTRGCPFGCTFCRAGGVWGRRVRVRSVENVLAEIRTIIEQLGIRNIIFMTDSLTLNRKWAMEFFRSIPDAGLSFDWICNSRVDAVDADMLHLMKRAGCRLISYGVESGSQEILERCKKGIKPDDAVRAIEATRRAGIISMAYFVLGLPGETRETIEQTIQFAKRLNPDYVNFHVATPFPGTEFYDEALAHGWLTSSDWVEYEEEGSAVIRTDSLSTEELVRAQRRAMRQFYLRPRQILKELRGLPRHRRGQLRARLKAGLRVLSTLFRRR